MAFYTVGDAVITLSSTPGTTHVVEFPNASNGGTPLQLGGGFAMTVSVMVIPPVSNPTSIIEASQLGRIRLIQTRNRGFGGADYTQYWFSGYADGSEAVNGFTLETLDEARIVASVRPIQKFHQNPQNTLVWQVSASVNSSPDGGPSLTPSGGADDLTWMSEVIMSYTPGRVPTAAPPDYTGLAYGDMTYDPSGFSHGVCTSYRNLNATTDDPGDYTFATNPNEFWAMTQAVYPYPGRVISAPHYLVKGLSNNVVYNSLDNTTESSLASLTKWMTFLVLRDKKPNQTALEEVQTIHQEDVDEVGGTAWTPLLGELWDYENLGKLAQHQSDNRAATTIGFHIGMEEPGGPWTHAQGKTNFLALMDAKSEALDPGASINGGAGWSNADGFSTGVNTASADHFFKIMQAFNADPVLYGWASVYTMTIDHNDGVPVSEIVYSNNTGNQLLSNQPNAPIASKRGSGGGNQYAAIWRSPSGEDIAFIVQEAPATEQNAMDDFKELVRLLQISNPELFVEPASGLTATGDLIAGNAQVDGTASLLTPLDATGDLIAGNAQVNGTAETLTPLDATGDLIAGSAQIDGEASVPVPRSASGDLIAGSAQIDGEASIGQIADGTLIAGSAQVEGQASIPVYTSGDLVAGNAQVSGIAINGDGWSPVDTGADETWTGV